MLGVVVEVGTGDRRGSRKRRVDFGDNSNFLKPKGVEDEVIDDIEEENENTSCLRVMTNTSGKKKRYKFYFLISTIIIELIEARIYENGNSSKDGLTTIDCPLLRQRESEEDCQVMALKFEEHFKDQKVKERISKSCSEYFSSIPLVATIDELTDATSIKTSFAYSIVTHGQIGILEVILATMFLPKNSYCIHVDKKASSEFKNSVEKLLSCYKVRSLTIQSKLGKVWDGASKPRLKLTLQDKLVNHFVVSRNR